MIDLKVAVVNLPTLHFIFGYFPPILNKNSEMNLSSYDGIVSAIKSTKNLLIGDGEYCITNYADPSRTKWFFLNGICTDKQVWQINADLISKMFGVPVHSMHNPTNGLILDLAECVFGRTFDMMDATTKHLYHTLKKALLEEEKVVVLAHSQGGIIVANILTAILHDKDVSDKICKLEVYTFASASDDMPTGEYYCEHYANTLDYVARIGILEYKDEMYGTLYTRFAGGHLLNIHYLNAFEEGKFCSFNSKLYTYLK